MFSCYSVTFLRSVYEKDEVLMAVGITAVSFYLWNNAFKKGLLWKLQKWNEIWKHLL